MRTALRNEGPFSFDVTGFRLHQWIEEKTNHPLEEDTQLSKKTLSRTETRDDIPVLRLASRFHTSFRTARVNCLIAGACVAISSVPSILRAQTSAQVSSPPVTYRLPAPPYPAARVEAPIDPEAAVNAMSLTPTQSSELMLIRARTSPLVMALSAKVNVALESDRVMKGIVTNRVTSALIDSLKILHAAQKAALDSVLTPEQRARFTAAMARMRDASGQNRSPRVPVANPSKPAEL